MCCIKKIAQNKKRQVLIFSAVGKCKKNDKKLTDILIEFTKEKNIDKYYKIISKKFKNLAKILDKENEINKIIINYLNKFISDGDRDYLISRGEYLTAYLMSLFLNIKFIPAEKLLFFKDENIDYKKTKKRLNYYIKRYKQIVTCGFYGVSNNKIKLLARGGGDITGAIFSKAINAKTYENYTDQDGIKQTNPTIVRNAKTIKKIGMKDCLVLTQCDANVLHCDVCQILEDTDIIVKVKNVLSPNKNYTTVDHKNHRCVFVCYKSMGDFCQIVVKTPSVDKLKKFYDSVNYLSNNYVYICTDKQNLPNFVRQIYLCIEK